MGYSWEAFGHFGETLGLHFGALGLHLGTLGVHVGVLCALWGVALDPLGGPSYLSIRTKPLSTCISDPRLEFYKQPGGLVPRARGRIYVACGEHPAAGGLYMSF